MYKARSNNCRDITIMQTKVTPRQKMKRQVNFIFLANCISQTMDKEMWISVFMHWRIQVMGPGGHRAPPLFPLFFRPNWGLAYVQTITKLWLVPSAKQRRDPCSGPPTDSTNYRKCVSNFPSTCLAIISLATNKTKVFFNWPIVVRTQIWVHNWKSRTRISALFRRRS